VGDVAGLQVGLQRQQQGEEELVLLVQTPGRVAVHLDADAADFSISHHLFIQEVSMRCVE